MKNQRLSNVVDYNQILNFRLSSSFLAAKYGDLYQHKIVWRGVCVYFKSLEWMHKMALLKNLLINLRGTARERVCTVHGDRGRRGGRLSSRLP